MCEHCEDESLEAEIWEELEPVSVEEEPWRCDHSSFDPDDPDHNDLDELELEGVIEEAHCLRDAVWRQLSTFPYEHLCAEHKRERAAYYTEEFGEVPPPIGLEGVERFLKIKDTEACEEIGAFDDSVGECGKPATWVEIGTIELFACDEHRDAMSNEPTGTTPVA